MKITLLVMCGLVGLSSFATQKEDVLLRAVPPRFSEKAYLRFNETGNRTDWGNPYHKCIEEFEQLLACESNERKGRFIPKITEFLTAILDMRTWTINAHDADLKSFLNIQPIVELGSARYGLAVAQAVTWFPEELPSDLVARARAELKRRIFEPYLLTAAEAKSNKGRLNFSIREHWWFRTKNNWNAVCHSLVVRAALACYPQGSEARKTILASAIDAVPYFLAGFTDDGYCSEGAGYWNYGFGHFLDMGLALREAPEQIDLFSGEKVRKIAEYGFSYRLTESISPWFADGGGIPDKPLLEKCLRIWPGTDPGALPPRTDFTTAQVSLVRNIAGGLALGCKGGHNAEFHNHNDVGSYDIAVGNVLVCGDAGGEVYTKRTFSKDRYLSKVLNSYGHPVPRVNGVLQGTGEAFRARLVSSESSKDHEKIVLDLTAAYECPELKSLVRSFSVDRRKGTIAISDTVKFNTPCLFEDPIITCGRHEGIEGSDTMRTGKVCVGAASLSFTVETSATSETFSETIDNPGRTPIQAFGVRLANVTDATVSYTFRNDNGSRPKAEPVHPQHLAYRSFQREFAETAAFAKLGIKLRAFGVCNTENALGKPYSDYPNVWKASGVYDFAVFDRMVEELLAASPDATFLCLIDLNTPLWLQRKLNIDSFGAISHAAANPRWRAETHRYLRDFLDHAEAKYGRLIRAYSLMAGMTTEWFEFRCPYTSTTKNAAWRDWCKKNGVAGGETTPSVESMARGAFEGVLFDPATESEKIAYWRFHNGLVADALLDAAKIVREKVGDTKEIGSFFGYYFICNKGLGPICHLDYERVIASPYIDFFSSPATYTERGCGFGTSSMAVPGTLRRHGKRVLHEIDFWPNGLEPPWNSPEHYWKTPGDVIAGNTREFAYALVNGLSTWWFDMWGDMYKTPGMKARIARLAEIHARFAGNLPPPDADFLIVADPESACAMANPDVKCPDGFIPSNGCGEQLVLAASRLGVTYDTCSFNDLPHLDLSRTRLVCLPATWVITPEKERILRDVVCRDGRTVLWTYAPGVSDGKTLDARRVADWTGTPFKTPEVTTTPRDGWHAVHAYDWRKLTPDKMREIAKAAGCFFATDELLPVVSNGRLLAIHCKDGGPKTVRLRRRCREVVELVSDRVVAKDTDSFVYTFASPDTAIFELRD